MMKEPRSSRIGWYRTSGFFEKMAYIVATRTMMRSIRANAALRMKNMTPMTPTTRPWVDDQQVLTKDRSDRKLTGNPKMLVKNSRKMALTKLTAAIEMLKAFVFLSMYGRRMEIAIKRPALRMRMPMACAVPEPCPSPTKRPMTKTNPRTGMMNQ